jgi:ribosomal-protein-alanine N-acetyltransferase
MIKEININDKEIIEKVENTFPTFFSKNSIFESFKQNAFTKYFIYMEKSNIIGIVNYYDLYDRFELAYIEVVEEYRNKKIGSSLMDYLINLGNNKKIENITLEVNVNNKYAIDLYKKYDFEIVAIRKSYYDGVDGYLMERKMM